MTYQILENGYGEKTAILNYNGMKFIGQSTPDGRFLLKREDWNLDKSDINQVVSSSVIVYHMYFKKFKEPFTKPCFKVSDNELAFLKTFTLDLIKEMYN